MNWTFLLARTKSEKRVFTILSVFRVYLLKRDDHLRRYSNIYVEIPKIDDANLKGTLWAFKQKPALKMWVRYGISIVLLLMSSNKAISGFVDSRTSTFGESWTHVCNITFSLFGLTCT